MRIKLSQYAKNNGISYTTAYRHFNSGKLKGVKLHTGTILIDVENEVISDKNSINVVLYARVSSSENKDNAISQMKRLKDYAAAKGYKVVKEVIEIGSGLNDNRKKLTNILEDKNWDLIIVEHKDRFSRFGINFIEKLLNQTNRKIEIINNTKGQKEDLMEDFVSIITSFCARLYGLRRNKRKTEQIIKILKD